MHARDLDRDVECFARKFAESLRKVLCLHGLDSHIELDIGKFEDPLFTDASISGYTVRSVSCLATISASAARIASTSRCPVSLTASGML